MGCLTSPLLVAGKGVGSHRPGRQRKRRSLLRTGKERTERSFSKAKEAKSQH